MRNFISIILPFLFLAQSFDILYLLSQIIAPWDLTTFEFITLNTVVFIPWPLHPLLVLTNLAGLIPYYPYLVLFYLVFGLSIGVIFLGLQKRLKWALYIMAFASLTHPLTSWFILRGFIELNTYNILTLILIGLIYTGIFFWVRKNYH